MGTMSIFSGIGDFVKKIKQYLYEVRIEIGKIIWPEKDKATKTTYVVVVFIILVTIFLGLIDIGFSKIISFLI